MCAHSAEGAMGLIINQRANHITFPDLLERLGISARNPETSITSDVLSLSIQVGGPVETGRGFVLHSSDYFAEDSTLAIEQGVCLTATIDILKAIAQGRGPDRASWRSAMPAGRRGSSRPRSRPTAGCIARPIPI